MKMHFTRDSFIKFIIFFLTCLALSLFKPLGVLNDIFYSNKLVKVLILINCLLMYIVIGKRVRLTKYLFTIMIGFILLIILRIAGDILRGRNFLLSVRGSISYLYIIMIIPLFYSLKSEKDLQKIIKVISNLTILSYMLRAFISAYYSVFHKRILIPISTESAIDSWFRDGVLRINPPCFGIIIIPMCIYLYECSNIKKEKIKYILYITVAILYSILVHRARSLTFYQFIELMFLIYIKQNSKFLKGLLIIIVVCMGIYIIGSSKFQSVFNSLFSLNNIRYRTSNLSRRFSYPYFYKLFLNNFWFGTGFLDYEEKVVINSGIASGLSDVGILYSSVQMGVGIIIFYISFIVRGICAYKNNFCRNRNLAVLSIGIVLSVALTAINIDWFYNIYVYSVPFGIVFVEYCAQVCWRDCGV